MDRRTRTSFPFFNGTQRLRCQNAHLSRTILNRQQRSPSQSPNQKSQIKIQKFCSRPGARSSRSARCKSFRLLWRLRDLRRNMASVAGLKKSFFAGIDQVENREGLEKLRLKYLGREKEILTAVLFIFSSCLRISCLSLKQTKMNSCLLVWRNPNR